MTADLDKLSRQRIDYEEEPDGSVTAILTVTLPDGTVQRYRATSTPEELEQFANVIATHETKAIRRIEGELSDEEIAGLFGDIARGIGKVAKGVAKVATSKVFKFAAKGIQAIAPALGPYAPAATAIGGGMQVASKIAKSALAAEGGAKRAAKALGINAHKTASRMTRGKPRLTKAVTRWGNKKRKGAFSLVGKMIADTRGRMRKALSKADKARKKKSDRQKKKDAAKAFIRALAKSRKRRAALAKKKKDAKKKRRSKPKAKPKRKTTTKISVLAAARTGRLRSNKPGDVSEKKLKSAVKKGRVFWISA